MAETVTIEEVILGPADAGLPMTIEEFEEAEFEPGYRYELIHGVLIVTPPPGEEERGSNEQLGYWLLSYQEHHRRGRSLDHTLPEQNVRIGPHSRRCDRAIWAGLGRFPDVRHDMPTIVVEFVSSRARDRRRDYEEKRADYLSAGVREYWIIDRFRRRMLALSNRGGQWTEKFVSEGETYQSELLPGFRLDLAKLLAVADRYDLRD